MPSTPEGEAGRVADSDEGMNGHVGGSGKLTIMDITHPIKAM